jgi:hypothetical protein
MQWPIMVYHEHLPANAIRPSPIAALVDLGQSLAVQ